MRLNETYPDSAGKGIMDYIPNVPWPAEDNTSLNISYYYSRSGEKSASAIYEKMYATNPMALGKSIWMIYGETWTKLWRIYGLEYNPINNYDMRETLSEGENRNQTSTGSASGTTGSTNTINSTLTHSGSDTLKQTGTDSTSTHSTETGTDTSTHSGIDTIDRTGTEKMDSTGTEKTAVSTYGFNSTTSVPSGDQMRTPDLDELRTLDLQDSTTYNTTDTRTPNLSTSGTNENTRNLTDTNTYNSSNATVGTDTMSGTQSSESTGHLTDDIERTHTLQRSGNIGVTTSQQMIESEINLWKWNFFENEVFPALDKILTLRIYD